MRIAAKPLARYPWYLRPFFWKQRRKYGAVLVELTGLVAFQNLSSKFNSALDVAPQGFCRLQQPAQQAQPGTLQA